MVYLGPMTERLQEAVLEKLRPLRARIWELIDQDTLFLCTGNALELFGQYIVKEDGSRLECLSLFPLYAQRDMMHRHNSVFLGSFEGKAVMGFKSQFTFATPLSQQIALFPVEKGVGLNKKCPFEGVRLPELLRHLPAGAAAHQQPALHPVPAGPPGRPLRPPGPGGTGAGRL